MVILVQRHMRSRRKLLATEEEQAELAQEFSYFGIAPYNPLHVRRPTRWLAIRSRDTLSVQAAFRLNKPRPCSWAEGVFSSRKIFIAPPVNGWTLVLGVGLPNPNNDVDVCYLFLRELSRRLGHVQFFQADELLQHHAWAQVESGRVLRGYAWAGTTIWNQGVKTGDEVALGMNCFCYGENPGSDDLAVADQLLTQLQLELPCLTMVVDQVRPALAQQMQDHPGQLSDLWQQFGTVPLPQQAAKQHRHKHQLGS